MRTVRCCVCPYLYLRGVIFENNSRKQETMFGIVIRKCYYYTVRRRCDGFSPGANLCLRLTRLMYEARKYIISVFHRCYAYCFVKCYYAKLTYAQKKYAILGISGQKSDQIESYLGF